VSRVLEDEHLLYTLDELDYYSWKEEGGTNEGGFLLRIDIPGSLSCVDAVKGAGRPNAVGDDRHVADSPFHHLGKKLYLLIG